MLKSQSGDGVRLPPAAAFFLGESDVDVNGSSGITANRPRCRHGDGGPYVAVWNRIGYLKNL